MRRNHLTIRQGCQPLQYCSPCFEIGIPHIRHTIDTQHLAGENDAATSIDHNKAARLERVPIVPDFDIYAAGRFNDTGVDNPGRTNDGSLSHAPVADGAAGIPDAVGAVVDHESIGLAVIKDGNTASRKTCVAENMVGRCLQIDRQHHRFAGQAVYRLKHEPTRLFVRARADRHDTRTADDESEVADEAPVAR